MTKKGSDKPTQKKLKGKVQASAVSPGRHEFHCKICSHPKREEIEQAFLTWTSPIQIAENYGVSRDSVYRHAHARAHALYSQMGASFNAQEHCFSWPWGAKIRFGFLGRDEDVYPHQGPRYTFIGFDESTHMTEHRIRYMASRLGSADDDDGPGIYRGPKALDARVNSEAQECTLARSVL
jgi:hypothetical protein